ncbi:TraR/DksA C4-type zinc finger protein [candidate division WOR-3 bacterium]|nr:TraR/DksA C4-type zinc finger protein [candidate division WOR-3 bacterium]
MSKGLNYKYFQKLLQKKRVEVLEEIRDLEPKVEDNPLETGEESTPFPTHIADVSDIESRRDRDSYMISQYTQDLKDIDAALQRILDKTYGICVDCEGEIKKERLKAIPYTRYCKSCAVNREKTNWKKAEF